MLVLLLALGAPCAAQEMGITTEFSLDDPKLPVTDAEYIASFIVK